MQDNIFTQYITRKSTIFKKNRDVLRPSFVPEHLPHRREYLDKLASILSPAFKGDRPSNVMIFGNTGTGKTAVALYLGKEIKKGKVNETQQLGRTCAICGGFIGKGFTECSLNHDASSAGLKCAKCGYQTHGDFDTCAACKSPMSQSVRCPQCGKANYLYNDECTHCGTENPSRFLRVEYFYINCEVVDTPYGILQNIGNRFVKDFDDRIPPTGWSTERVYNMVREKMDTEKRVVIIVLDEVDNLVYKSGDDVLYQLNKMNDEFENARISIVGISNDLKFTNFLDMRVKSRMSEEKIILHPYDARQLEDILQRRVELAFESSSVGEGVVQLCAALAAQEHGDARRALTLLRVAGEIAERAREVQVSEVHVRRAKSEIEMDCVAEAIRTLPTQSKVILLSIITNEEMGNKKMTTGEVYSTYSEMVKRCYMDRLTQRRVTDLISELDMLGIAHARVKSFGRGGRTKEIQSSVPRGETKKMLFDDPMLVELKNFKPLSQMKLM